MQGNFFFSRVESDAVPRHYSAGRLGFGVKLARKFPDRHVQTANAFPRHHRAWPGGPCWNAAISANPNF